MLFLKFAAKEKLEIVLSAPVPAYLLSGRQGEAGGRGDVGGIPPAEPSQFRSDIFKQTPPRITFMLNLPEKIIIFDTELTCWPGSDDHDWDRPNEYREIVQIGAILIDTKKLIELDYLDILIKPVKNPVLSNYFIDLTGITREEVDKKGISYKDAFPKFISWSKDYNFYSYGGDEKILEENCEFAGIPFPFKNSRFVDIRDVFRKHFSNINNYQSGSIMSIFGKKSALRPHNALNDVRILLEGLWELDKIA